jgi:hypothetical protein
MPNDVATNDGLNFVKDMCASPRIVVIWTV